MTIKKPMKVKPVGGAKPAAGGAAIASRLQLDTPAETAKPKGLSGPAVTAAFIAALLSLGSAGVLTYLLWKHWEFLMPA